jgi:hypothetical protein
MTNLNTYMINRIGNYAPGRTDGGAGTLQAIHRRDYNALDPHAVLIIVDQAITYLRSRRETLEAEATRLEQLRPVLATPHWRKDRHGQPRYLYLIHPTQDDGSRRREYIGADPEAQAVALARVKAWDALQAVKNEMREIDHRLAAITGHLARALHAAANGFDPYW